MTIDPTPGLPVLPKGYLWHMNEFTNVNNNFLAGSIVLCEQLRTGLHGEVECRIYVRPGEDTAEKILEAAKAAYEEWLILPGKAAAMKRMQSERNHRFSGLYPPNTLVE